MCLLFIIFPFCSGAIIFGSDQEVREVMSAVRRNNATGTFSWIGSDGWSARNLVSDGNEPEVTYFYENISNRNKHLITMLKFGYEYSFRACIEEYFRFL